MMHMAASRSWQTWHNECQSSQSTRTGTCPLQSPQLRTALPRLMRRSRDHDLAPSWATLATPSLKLISCRERRYRLFISCSNGQPGKSDLAFLSNAYLASKRRSLCRFASSPLLEQPFGQQEVM